MSPKTELPPELGEGYELTFARLQRMFRARGVSSHDAADLAQEAAARLIVHLRRRGMEPNPFHEGMNALIHRIAMNLLIDRARAGRNDPVSLDAAMEVAGPEDPADVVYRAQRVRAVRSAVAGLSQRHRRAIALSLDGLGPAEIAQDFGIERNAADALLYRARRRLAESIRLDQIGAAIGIAVARLRASVRRGEMHDPVLNAAPAGLHIATGLIGLAMTATFSVPPAVATSDHAGSPLPVVTTAGSAVDQSAALTTVDVGVVAVAPHAARPLRRNAVQVGTEVPGASNGRSALGLEVWREHDGKGITGPTVERASDEACRAGTCEVLR